jgi:hypothetical protein
MQGILPTVYKIHGYRFILMGSRPEDLIRNVEEEEDEGEGEGEAVLVLN